jgi:hypothetical protein
VEAREICSLEVGAIDVTPSLPFTAGEGVEITGDDVGEMTSIGESAVDGGGVGL